MALTATDSNSNVYPLGCFAVERVELPIGREVRPLIGNREILVGRMDPDTERVVGNLRWNLVWAGARDEFLPARTSAQTMSLLRGWCNNGEAITLAGADFCGLWEEPLRRVQDGTNKVFSGAARWWASGEAIYVDGTLKTLTTHYTVDADAGVVTFVDAPATTAVVTCTVARAPHCRVLSVDPKPLNRFATVRYETAATLVEVGP